MNPEITLLIILYAVFVGVTAFLHRSSGSHRRLYAQAKLVTGLGYIFLAIYSAYRVEFKSVVYLLFPAFWAALAGDYFLGIAHKNKNHKGMTFLAGATAFMVTHVLFYIAYSRVWPVTIGECAVPVVVIAIVALVTRRGDFEFGKMKTLVFPYALCVSLVPSKIISQLFLSISAGHFSMSENFSLIVVLVASMLFLSSDFILLVMYFSKKERAGLGQWNLLTYYAAMAIFALSIQCL